MAQIEGVIYCDNCGVEITWGSYLPARAGGAPPRRSDYCCRECFQGLPCRCGERMDMDDERRGGSASSLVEGL